MRSEEIAVPYHTEYQNWGDKIHYLHTPSRELNGLKVDVLFPLGGAFFENQNEAGLTHLTEHALISDNAGRGLTRPMIDAFLRFRGSRRNAFTQSLALSGEIQGSKRYQSELTNLLLDLFLDHTLTRETWEGEKRIVITEMGNKLDTPGFDLNRRILEASFTDDFGRYPTTGGYPETIMPLTVHDGQRRLLEICTQSPLVVAISGGEPSTELVDRLQSLVEVYPYDPQSVPLNYYPTVSLTPNHSTLLLHPAASNAAEITIGFPDEETSFKTVIVKTFLYNLVFRGISAPLYNRLRNELGIIYSLSHGHSYNGQVISTTVETRLQYIDQVLGEISRIWQYTPDQLRELIEPFFEIEKAYLTETWLQDADSPRSNTNDALENLLSHNTLVTTSEMINLIQSVTLEEVLHEYERQQKLYEGHKRLLVVSSNKSISRDPFDQVLDYFGHSDFKQKLKQLWAGFRQRVVQVSS